MNTDGCLWNTYNTFVFIGESLLIIMPIEFPKYFFISDHFYRELDDCQLLVNAQNADQ